MLGCHFVSGNNARTAEEREPACHVEREALKAPAFLKAPAGSLDSIFDVGFWRKEQVNPVTVTAHSFGTRRNRGRRPIIISALNALPTASGSRIYSGFEKSDDWELWSLRCTCSISTDTCKAKRYINT